uniref:Pacifastin domain-containing protein n=1 Tax=Photinus pyralis TaxID=7054 RepID=A0A1Y1KKC8_PHOPY
MKSVSILCLGLLFGVVFADESCRIGETKQGECELCECLVLQDGIVDWYCTQKDCGHYYHNRFKRGSEKCPLGDHKIGECHNCRCIAVDGEGGTDWACLQSSCTQKVEVPKRDKELPCKLGTIRRTPCQECRCGFSGGRTFWTCIRHQCNETLRSRNELVRLRRDTTIASDLINTPCALNDSFKLDCNTCYCKSDKTGYLCTSFTCSAESTNSSLAVNSTMETVTQSVDPTPETVTPLETTTNSNVSSSPQR